MDLGFFNKYPYTDFHELNLDWIIAALKEYIKELREFVQINAIKYADPLQWDITRQYEKNTVVIDPLTGTAYISVQPVPAGISLARPEYWTVVFDLSVFITAANNNFTVRVETTTTTTATFDTAAGEWLIWDQKLYKANVNITAGDAYVEGSNITRWTVEEGLQEIGTALAALAANVGDLNDLTTTDKSSIVNAINDVVSALTTVVNNVGALASLTTTDKSSIVNAINELVNDLGTLSGALTALSGNVGDLANLTTVDQSSIVNAINELVSDLGTMNGTLTALSGNVGDLADLVTTDKSSIVNAINEIAGNTGSSACVTLEEFGAVGDGVTDDSDALRAAIADGRIIALLDKTYLCSQSVEIRTGLVIIGCGADSTILKANLISNDARFFNLSNMRCEPAGVDPFMTGQISSHHYEGVYFSGNDIFEVTGESMFAYFADVRCHTVDTFIHMASGVYYTDTWTFIGCKFYKVHHIFDNEALLYDVNFTSCCFESSNDYQCDIVKTYRGDIISFDGCYFEEVNALDSDGTGSNAAIGTVAFERCFIAGNSTVFRSYTAASFTPSITFSIADSRVYRGSAIFVLNGDTYGSLAVNCSGNSYYLSEFRLYFDSDAFATNNTFIQRSDIDLKILEETDSTTGITLALFYRKGLHPVIKDQNLNLSWDRFVNITLSTGNFLVPLDAMYIGCCMAIQAGDNVYLPIYFRIMSTSQYRLICVGPSTMNSITID